jgi:Mg2+ and Co2+ transporter CorA
MHRQHLGTDELYSEVRSEIFDMVQYLDSNLLRRQSGSMHRLTVVTILGLIGTIATGFLGMNLIAEADAPLATKVVFFTLTTLVFGALTLITVAMSQRLTNLLDWFSGERDIG